MHYIDKSFQHLFANKPSLEIGVVCQAFDAPFQSQESKEISAYMVGDGIVSSIFTPRQWESPFMGPRRVSAPPPKKKRLYKLWGARTVLAREKPQPIYETHKGDNQQNPLPIYGDLSEWQTTKAFPH